MQDRLKILFIIDKLGPAGTELQLVELMRRLTRDSFELFLCCLAGSNSNMAEYLPADMKVKGKVLLFDIRSTYSLAAIAALYRLSSFIRTVRIDIIQTYHLKAKFIGTLAGKIAGIKTFSCIRDLGLGINVINFVPNKLANLCTDRFLVNSVSIKEYLISRENIPGRMIDVITNGVDMEKFYPASTAVKIDNKKKMGFDSGDIVIGIIANLRPVKAHNIFIKAAAQLHRREPRAKFVIVGDGALREELKQQAFESGLLNNVLFAGSCSNVQFYLQAFDIGVLCSISEGFSNTVLEYMASGLPVVATNVGGNCEQIRDGHNGFLVPPNDSQGLADSILKLIEDENLRNAMSEQAFLDCRRYFSMENMIGRLEEYYYHVGVAGGIYSRNNKVHEN